MSEGKSETDRTRDDGGKPTTGGRATSGSVSGKRDDGAADGGSGSGGRPPSGPVRLTERQRREARELRRSRKRSRAGRVGPSGTSLKTAVWRGLKATAVETGRALAFLGRGIRGVLGRVASALLTLIGATLTVVGAILTRIGRLVAAVVGALGRVALALDRILTPARAVVAASLLAGIMLGISQFLDYRAVEIGGAGYDPILDLTRAPRTDVETPIGAHSVVLVIAAVAAVGSCLGFIVSGRRYLALPIVAVGAIALAVGLVIDLPRGLDSGAASASYADAQAVLLGGFWLEIASGAVLLATGLLMTLAPGGALLGSGHAASPAGRRRPATDRTRRRRGTVPGGAA